MRKLSIIQMVSARDEWGGIEQHAKDLAKGLKERGHEVAVAARDVDFVVAKYREVCPVYTFPIRGSIDLPSIWGIANLIKRNKVDIIHTHTSRDAWTALFATMAAGRGKTVTTRHAPFPAKRDPVHTWFYHKLALIICVSRFVKEAFQGAKPAPYADHVSVIYPGVDARKFGNDAENGGRGKLGISGKEFIAGFVGRITPEKGVHVLIRAAAALKAKGKTCKVVVVGSPDPHYPEYVNELKSLACEGGIENDVIFYGFTNHVAAVVSSFNTLVLPAISEESLSLVLIEAMLCGKPVIATNTGGPLEIVDDGMNGYLVAPGAHEEMAAALEKLLDNPEMAGRMGKAAQEKAHAKFTLARMLDEIERQYYNILDR